MRLSSPSRLEKNMAFKVEVTEAAQESVRAAIEYVRLVFDSPKAAKSLKVEFDKFLENVAELPEMYPLMEDEALRCIGYRRALIKAYVAVYTFEDEKITVHGFFHQLQDYARFF